MASSNRGAKSLNGSMLPPCVVQGRASTTAVTKTGAIVERAAGVDGPLTKRPRLSTDEKTQNDDVIICDDGVNDAMREDMERILGSTVSVFSKRRRPPSMQKSSARKSIQAPSAASGTKKNCEIGTSKILIESVKNISTAEFQQLRQSSNASMETKKGDDSDSDIEILEVRSSGGKIGSAHSEKGVQQGVTSSTRPLLPRPPPPLLRPALPPPPLRPFRPATQVLVPNVVCSSGMPRLRLITPSALADHASLVRRSRLVHYPPSSAAAPNPTVRILSTARAIVAESRQQANTSTGTATATVRPVVRYPIMTPSGKAAQPPPLSPQHPPAPRPTFGRSQVPAVGDEDPLPVFGQHYGYIRRPAAGASQPLCSTPIKQPKPATGPAGQTGKNAKRSRKKSISSISSSSGDSVSTVSSENVTETSSDKSKASGGSIEMETMDGGEKSSGEFPFGCYGRFRQGVTRRVQPDETEFDGWFICDICNDISTNNISFINHLYSHLIYPSMEDSRLEDQTRCGSCWREFQDPFRLIDHIEQVHQQKSSSHLICYICEVAFVDVSSLRNHIRKCHHGTCDMPYSCKKCRLWSSLYDDIWDHYLMDHKDSLFLMCPLCLMTMEATIMQSKYGSKLAMANTEQFVAHISRHTEIGGKFGCKNCKLQFITKTELKNHTKSGHQRQCHKQNRTDPDWPPMKWNGYQPLTRTKSHFRRLPSRLVENLQPTAVTFTIDQADCIECQRPMDDAKHFSKKLQECDRCSFSTYCKHAYGHHKSMAHDPDASSLPFEYSLAKPLRAALLPTVCHCQCGYKSRLGNEIASHIQSCNVADGKIIVSSRPITHGRIDCQLGPFELLDALKLVPKRATVWPVDNHRKMEWTDTGESSTPAVLDQSNDTLQCDEIASPVRSGRPRLQLADRKRLKNETEAVTTERRTRTNGTQQMFKKLSQDFCGIYQRWSMQIDKLQKEMENVMAMKMPELTDSSDTAMEEEKNKLMTLLLRVDSDMDSQ